MKYKLLVISIGVYANAEQYKASLTYKILQELSKHFTMTIHLYFYKNATIEKNEFNSIYKIEHLKLKGANPFAKLINLTWLHLNNLRIIWKTRDSDLIWMRLTSSITATFSFLYPLLNPRKKFYVQLYTSSVNSSKLVRDTLDFILMLNLRFFKYIGGGKSELNIRRYRIPERKNIPVEVGMPDYGFSEKDFSVLRLVHIGTLNGREIWKSLKGLGLFIKKHPNIDITYDIIGIGSDKEVSLLNNEINNFNLHSVVKYHGGVSVNEVKKVFNKCNVGVTYIPMNEYFQHPSTKTVEYCLAGMAVIATKFKFTSEFVSDNIGILCEDNPESFAEGIEKLHIKRDKYNSMEIRKSFEAYEIAETMKTKYIPLLQKIVLK